MAVRFPPLLLATLFGTTLTVQAVTAPTQSMDKLIVKADGKTQWSGQFTHNTQTLVFSLEKDEKRNIHFAFETPSGHYTGTVQFPSRTLDLDGQTLSRQDKTLFHSFSQELRESLVHQAQTPFALLNFNGALSTWSRALSS